MLTKYDHVEHPIPGVTCYEAGHPVPDENTFRATQAVLDMTADLDKSDTVLFLLSGGGSALFEQPVVAEAELQSITRQLLACGADIVEMNTIRKRLSMVKGGKFAQWCAPAHVEVIVLSDILGDPLDMIASGPAASDKSTCADALAIAEKYQLALSDSAMDCLRTETPKELTNVSTQIIGSVRELCKAASEIAEELGYEPILLTDHLDCEAKEAGAFLADVLRTHACDGKKLAYLCSFLCFLGSALIQNLLVFSIEVQAPLRTLLFQFLDADCFGFRFLRFDLTTLQLIGRNILNAQCSALGNLTILQLSGDLGQVFFQIKQEEEHHENHDANTRKR